VSLFETVLEAAAFDSRSTTSAQIATQIIFLRIIAGSGGLKGKKMAE
jgi:hypothetical protein